MHDFAACTIIVKSDLSRARVLADSWSEYHPKCPFYALLLDSSQDFFEPESEHFLIVPIADLRIRNLNGFLFKYSASECKYAARPYFLEHLLKNHVISKLVYFDADALILNPLDELNGCLGVSDIVLVAHLTSPLPNDGHRPTEDDIRRDGAYSPGFIGLRNSVNVSTMLKWWQQKLYHNPMVNISGERMRERRWMNVVPGMFDRVEIERHPGYDVGYWNFHERVVTITAAANVNGEPLYFVRFSGFDPGQPSVISQYQNRYLMSELGDVQKLFKKYQDLLIKRGLLETMTWPYDHDFFRNGIRIPESARRYYESLGPDIMHLGNPFTWLD
jgi:hypothetical protein